MNLNNQPQTKKGFDPENLTFDGVRIKEGDQVTINNSADYEVVASIKVAMGNGETYKRLFESLGIIRPSAYDIQMVQDVYIPLCELNITAHHPKQSELEKAQDNLLGKEYELIYDLQNSPCIGDPAEKLDRYYQARKKVEELKNNK